jgi:hypothetical protein
MDLVADIEAFNKSSQPPIELLVTRDGRTVAKLPRAAREIVVKETSLNKDVKVTPQDVAWLCEEARLASAPGMALLEAALGALGDMARQTEDEGV